MKPFWKRATLWSLPFVVLSLALWRVQEARSWLPRVSPLSRATSSPFPLLLPMAWREDGLWLLTYPHDLSYPASNEMAPPPFVWKEVPNWNRQSVLLRAATLFGDSQAALARDTSFLVRGRGDENLELWRNGKRIRVMREKPANKPRRLNPSRVAVIALSPNGSRIAGDSQLYGLYNGEQTAADFSPLGIVLWDAATGRQITRQSAIEGAFTSLSFSDDGTWFAGTTCDGYIFVFDGKTGQKRRVWRAHQWLASNLAWSRDGKFLVSGANPRIGETVSRYAFHWGFGIGTSGGDTAGTITASGDKGEKVTIVTTQNGDTTINGQSDRDLKLWDAQSGKLLRQWPSASGITSLQWSPDGNHIAVGTHGEALLFDAKTWKITRRFPLPNDRKSPATVAFSPDGRTLAVASRSALSLWRLR